MIEDKNKDKKIADTIAKMTPEQRVKYLEDITVNAKKQITETERLLKESQELLEKNRREIVRKALLDDQKRLKDQEEFKRKEDKKEISSLFESYGNELEKNVENARLPSTNRIVGLYTQLQQLRYYQSDDGEVDYARVIILQDIRKEVLEVLRQYKEVPDEVKELADATYRLTKELLPANSEKIRYFP